MMSTPYKLLALDLDGTLLTNAGDSELTISTNNCRWIQAARDVGIQVVLATGRHRSSSTLNQVIQQLNIPLSLVVVNGSEVWTSKGELLRRQAFTEEEAALLYRLARKFHLSCIGFTPSGRVKAEDLKRGFSNSTWLKFVLLLNTVNTQKSGDFSGASEANLIGSARWGVVERLRSSGRFECSSSTPLNLEVNPLGVNKAFGLRLLCDSLGIEKHEVAAIGDGFNDIEMLRWAGLGIAMMNAPNEVRQAADGVTETCEHDGVAKAVEQIVLAQS
jgi:Cof subfamily protein (haloacid dehalogenase superfamily)